MADPRLRWQQIQAPDLSTASEALARANLSFNKGFETANSVLESYNAGQQEKEDAALVQELAGLKDEQAFDAFIANGGLAGRNISAAMREYVLGARGEYLDQASTRADIGLTNARTGLTGAQTRQVDARTAIAQAAEGRDATRFGWETTDRQEGRARADWLRQNAGLAFDAQQAAYANGSLFSSAIGSHESGGGSDQYDTLFGHRNRETGVQVSQMTIGEAGRFASPGGQYGQSVNAEIGRVATPMGKYQIVGSTLRGLQSELGLPDDVPFSPAVQEQMGMYLAQRRLRGPMSAAGARTALRSEWEGFRHVSDADLDAIVAEVRAAPPVTRETILAAGAGSRPAPIQRNGDAFGRTMAESGLFTPEQIRGQTTPIYNVGAAADTRLEQERQRAETQAQDEFLFDALTDPTITGDPASQIAAIREAGFTGQQALDMYGRLDGFADTQRDVFSPEVESDPITEAAQQAAQAEQARLAENDPATRMFELGEQYDADPIGSIEERFGLELDTVQKEDLRSAIRQIADRYHISDGEAAVALAENYTRPSGIFTNRHNLENHFDTKAAIRFAQETFGTEARNRYMDHSQSATLTSVQSDRAMRRLDELRERAARYVQTEGEVPQEIIRQISGLQDALRTGSREVMAEQELLTYIRRSGLSSSFSNVDLSTREGRQQVASELTQRIQADPTIDQFEKSLLISALSS